MPSKEEFSIGNQFSFSSPLHRVELNSQSERIHGRFSYFGSPETEKFRWWPEEEEEDAEEELDVVIPHNAKSKDDQHCFARTSRAEEIAKHRREMLEMVEDLPEFAYELSLKDMVELPAKIGKEISREREEVVWMDKYGKGEEDQKNKKKNKKKKKKKNERIWLKRSNSVDSGGFLLKIFLPVNLSGKKSSGTPSPTSKVSPKPLGIGAKVDKAVEEEKKFEKNHGSRKMKGCYHFLHSKLKARE